MSRALQVAEAGSSAPDGACCGMCADAERAAAERAAAERAAAVAAVSAPAPLRSAAMTISLDRPGSGAPARAARLDRNADRRITAAGLVAAGLFVAAALATALIPATAARGPWLPLHLALAGGAGTAIAAVMPFFSAALVAAPPAASRVRVGALILVAGGAALVATRAFVPATALPPPGGVAVQAGGRRHGWATLAPLRRALGPSRPLVVVAYGAALADVLLGATLATAFVGGWVPVLERWSVLKPAHAWLNLLGFVSLVIAGTLLHLLPTVLGTRIAARASAAVAVAGLVLGAPLVALGFAIAGGPGPAASLVAGAGAIAALVGAAALAWHAVEVVRSRGRWNTDPGWHRLTSWGLVAAVGWFAVAVGLAAGRILLLGAVPAAWRIEDVVAPLAVGWVLQALVAAWSHLLPSIGPGGPPEHARQRRLLGRATRARLGAINLGTALLAIGIPTGGGPLVAAGAALAAVGLTTSLALGAGALLQVRQVGAAANG